MRHIQIGDIYDGIVGNHFYGINVPSNSTENIVKACELLEIEAFAIYDESNKRVFTSEKLLLHEEKERKEKQESHLKTLKLIEEFKKLPITLKRWDFKSRRITLERNEDPYYDPTIGLVAGVYLRMYKLDGDWQQQAYSEFNAEAYFSGSKLQRAKFIKRHNDLNVQEAIAIVLKIPEMLAEKKNITEKYQLRRY